MTPLRALAKKRGTACKCGSPHGRGIEIVRDGVVLVAGFLCDPCWDAALDGAERNRLQFDDLLAAGVSRAEANRIMIDRINGAPAS